MGNKHRYYDEEGDDFRRGRDGGRHRPRRNPQPAEQGRLDTYNGYRSPETAYQPAPAVAIVEERTAMPANERRVPYPNKPQSQHGQGNKRPYTPRQEPVVTGEPETVTVKWFNAEKGFGFVTDANGRDLFIHISAVKAANMATIEQGQNLVVQRGPGRNNQEAINRVLSAA